MLAISAMACEMRTVSASAALGKAVDAELELQVRHDDEEVGVARALAVAVRRALHVRDACLDRRHGVGDGTAGVVLAVDAEPHAGPLLDVGDDLEHPVREHAAVRVAQDADGRTGLERRHQQPHPVVGDRACSRRRSAPCRRTPAAPPRRGSAPCPAPSRGSPRASSAAPRPHGGRPTWPRASRRAPASPGGRGPGGRPRPAPRPCASRRTRRARRSCSDSSVRARSKNSVSFGIAPGQPPSMKPTP